MYLNLARKWRSKKFEEVIGQDFAIKVLKNCLYKNLISPVYLISGPKGCGKTTVARLFAAALNCENLLKFRENPKNFSLPCSSCHSCILFNKSAHPDFIEIDAASNTGVENVRQIIDSASFIPALGVKRIYLIDEAHMLSKAAFNALLKTLEEPPASVLFILATTEVNKVIETVRSRCFQLFFMPIDKDSLFNYLSLICKTEEIAFENEALKVIIQESSGSARDALNLLEKVRAGFNNVTKETVFIALGLMPEEYLITLFELIIEQKPNEMMAFYSGHNLDKFDQFIVFKKMVNLIYSSVTLKMNVTSPVSEISAYKLKTLINTCSLDLFIKMLDLCYSFELLLLKTANPTILMQTLLIKLSMINASSSTISKTHSSTSINGSQTSSVVQAKKGEEMQNQTSNTVHAKTINSLNKLEVDPTNATALNQEWSLFLSILEKINDPLLLSIFKQGHFKLTNNSIQLFFNKDFMFFKDCLESAKNTWRPLLSNAFKSPDSLDNEVSIEFVFEITNRAPLNSISPQFIAPVKKKIEELNNEKNFSSKSEINANSESNDSSRKMFKKSVTKVVAQDKNIPIDLDKFQKVNIISKIFPGKVTSSLVIDNILERKNE